MSQVLLSGALGSEQGDCATPAWSCFVSGQRDIAAGFAKPHPSPLVLSWPFEAQSLRLRLLFV